MSEINEAPTFKVGDEVEFEMSLGGILPRYSGDFDDGGNGRWLSGKIIDVTHDAITVQDLSGLWMWPNPDYSGHDRSVWSLPGYLRHKKKAADTSTVSTSTLHKCHCDMSDLLRVGCKCGGV